MHNSSSWPVAAFIFAVVASSCAEEPRSPPPTVLSEHMGLTTGAGRLSIGEDCSEFEGSTGCASGGVCLRQTPGFPPRGRCSQRCGTVYSTTQDGGLVPARTIGCPQVGGVQWACEQVMPGRDGFLCVPPREVDAKSAAAADDGGVP